MNKVPSAAAFDYHESVRLLQAFRAAIFEFTLLPEQELILPRLNKANVLRGAFGWECLRLVCGPNYMNDCSDFAKLKRCPYAVIFEGD